MITAAPPFACYQGGEDFNDPVTIVTLIWGVNNVDDWALPGLTVPPNTFGPDTDADNIQDVPNNFRFIANEDKPQNAGDYPILRCTESGFWGAPHAMVTVDGRWYLKRFAPEPRANKKYPGRNTY